MIKKESRALYQFSPHEEQEKQNKKQTYFSFMVKVFRESLELESFSRDRADAL